MPYRVIYTTLLALALVATVLDSGLLYAQVAPGPPIVQNAGTTLGAYKKFNCSTGTTCTLSSGVATITTAGGGAPTTSTYLLQTADASLPNAQALGALGTGLVINTTITGVQSIYGGSGTCGANTFFTALSASGVKTCGAPSSVATLDAITAAAGNQTGILNADFNIVWKWAKTTDTTIAFRFTESAAATNGTSTSGVPNQVLLKLDTLAASTMSPLSVYIGGNHVFSVSPTARQIVATNGTAANPPYAFASAVGSGVHWDGTYLYLDVSGSSILQVSALYALFNNSSFVGVPVGSAAVPSLTDNASETSGLFWSGGSVLGVSVNSIENSRFVSGAFQFSKGSADAVAYAINSRKSRGTVASPTVITTGDALVTFSGYGYVGGTNKYLEAARLEFDSTGTIADTTSGIGSLIKFKTTIDGTDTAPQTRIQWDKAGRPYYVTSGNSPTFTGGDCGTNPTVAGNDAVFQITVGTPNVSTSCSMTFSGAGWLTNAPNCYAESDTDIVATKSVETQTTLVISAVGAFTAASKIDVWCVGRL